VNRARIRGKSSTIGEVAEALPPASGRSKPVGSPSSQLVEIPLLSDDDVLPVLIENFDQALIRVARQFLVTLHLLRMVGKSTLYHG